MVIRRARTRNKATGETCFTHRLAASDRAGKQVRQVTLLNLGRHVDSFPAATPMLSGSTPPSGTNCLPRPRSAMTRGLPRCSSRLAGRCRAEHWRPQPGRVGLERAQAGKRIIGLRRDAPWRARTPARDTSAGCAGIRAARVGPTAATALHDAEAAQYPLPNIAAKRPATRPPMKAEPQPPMQVMTRSGDDRRASSAQCQRGFHTGWRGAPVQPRFALLTRQARNTR
jgi:hypothetical protein